MRQLRYKKGAGWDWNKALPIGSGRLGAMIYAPEDSEHYQLNEDSIWFGGPRNRNNPDARAHLDEVRCFILDGRIPEAERLLKYSFSGTPQSQHSYQTLGDVYFDFCGGLTSPAGYERKLDLETAVHAVVSTEETTGVTYAREVFASNVCQCIVSKFDVDKGTFELAASLQRMSFYEKTEHTDDALYITGNLGGGGLDFCCGMKFVAPGGTVSGLGEHLIAKDAREVIVYITAVSEFRTKNPRQEVERVLEEASRRSYEDLKKEHVKEYQSYFGRMSLELDYDKELDLLFTEERLKRIAQDKPDNGLLHTYFDYGRYLLISSSRGDCLPANLQGIWNKDLDAPWGSKYTININTEMNYWPAGMCHLSDCQMPLFRHMLRMEKNGRQTAKEMYGCSGFVAHHNTDLWGDTAPQDIYIPATYWVMGGAWLCTHIFEHYEYTHNKDFLKEMYPLLKGSVEFFLDFLIDVDGEYVTCPSVSPENTYIMEDGTRGCVTAGCTMDNEILHELFSHFLKVTEILEEKDVDFVDKVIQYKGRLPQIRIGKYGQIMEWREDYEEEEPGHRHISHLWALHPASQITVDGTKELCKAAKVTLERRLQNGGGHTGWSRAWIMNMYTRLWDGEKAYENLIQLLQQSTLENLLDNHPPFQIDGNFGAIAAIGEMLLQSNTERVVLLPALPKAWNKGSVTGMRAKGCAEYSISWENGSLKQATVKAERDYEMPVYYMGQCCMVKLKTGEKRVITLVDFE